MTLAGATLVLFWGALFGFLGLLAACGVISTPWAARPRTRPRAAIRVRAA